MAKFNGVRKLSKKLRGSSSIIPEDILADLPPRPSHPLPFDIEAAQKELQKSRARKFLEKYLRKMGCFCPSEEDWDRAYQGYESTQSERSQENANHQGLDMLASVPFPDPLLVDSLARRRSGIGAPLGTRLAMTSGNRLQHEHIPSAPLSLDEAVDTSLYEFATDAAFPGNKSRGTGLLSRNPASTNLARPSTSRGLESGRSSGRSDAAERRRRRRSNTFDRLTMEEAEVDTPPEPAAEPERTRSPSRSIIIRHREASSRSKRSRVCSTIIEEDTLEEEEGEKKVKTPVKPKKGHRRNRAIRFLDELKPESESVDAETAASSAPWPLPVPEIVVNGPPEDDAQLAGNLSKGSDEETMSEVKRGKQPERPYNLDFSEPSTPASGSSSSTDQRPGGFTAAAFAEPAEIRKQFSVHPARSSDFDGPESTTSFCGSFSSGQHTTSDASEAEPKSAGVQDEFPAQAETSHTFDFSLAEDASSGSSSGGQASGGFSRAAFAEPFALRMPAPDQPETGGIHGESSAVDGVEQEFSDDESIFAELDEEQDFSDDDDNDSVFPESEIPTPTETTEEAAENSGDLPDIRSHHPTLSWKAEPFYPLTPLGSPSGTAWTLGFTADGSIVRRPVLLEKVDPIEARRSRQHPLKMIKSLRKQIVRHHGEHYLNRIPEKKMLNPKDWDEVIPLDYYNEAKFYSQRRRPLKSVSVAYENDPETGHTTIHLLQPHPSTE